MQKKVQNVQKMLKFVYKRYKYYLSILTYICKDISRK